MLGPCTHVPLCLHLLSLCVSLSHLGEVSVIGPTRTHQGRHPPPALRLEPKLGFKAPAVPCSSLSSGGPRCSYSVKGMNGVAGGALASGAMGKPGAPEDATSVCVCPEVEEVGGRTEGAPQSCRGSRDISRGTVGNLPSSHPLPPAGCQLRRHLLAGAQGLWRNDWPWGKGGGLVAHIRL